MADLEGTFYRQPERLMRRKGAWRENSLPSCCLDRNQGWNDSLSKGEAEGSGQGERQGRRGQKGRKKSASGAETTRPAPPVLAPAPFRSLLSGKGIGTSVR